MHRSDGDCGAARDNRAGEVAVRKDDSLDFCLWLSVLSESAGGWQAGSVLLCGRRVRRRARRLIGKSDHGLFHGNPLDSWICDSAGNRLTERGSSEDGQSTS